VHTDVLLVKPERTSLLGRPSRRWEVMLQWIFKKLDGGMDWIDQAQDRDLWRVRVLVVMNLRVA
jgi:hypothetical protein